MKLGMYVCGACGQGVASGSAHSCPEMRERTKKEYEKHLPKPKPVMNELREGWELQDTLLALTVLNQNAPKIVLTNDECGWYATYYPGPPYTGGETTVLGGNPLEAIRLLKRTLKKEKKR